MPHALPVSARHDLPDQFPLLMQAAGQVTGALFCHSSFHSLREHTYAGSSCPKGFEDIILSTPEARPPSSEWLVCHGRSRAISRGAATRMLPVVMRRSP